MKDSLLPKLDGQRMLAPSQQPEPRVEESPHQTLAHALVLSTVMAASVVASQHASVDRKSQVSEERTVAGRDLTLMNKTTVQDNPPINGGDSSTADCTSLSAAATDTVGGLNSMPPPQQRAIHGTTDASSVDLGNHAEWMPTESTWGSSISTSETGAATRVGSDAVQETSAATNASSPPSNDVTASAGSVGKCRRTETHDREARPGSRSADMLVALMQELRSASGGQKTIAHVFASPARAPAAVGKSTTSSRVKLTRRSFAVATTNPPNAEAAPSSAASDGTTTPGSWTPTSAPCDLKPADVPRYLDTLRVQIQQLQAQHKKDLQTGVDQFERARAEFKASLEDCRREHDTLTNRLRASTEKLGHQRESNDALRKQIVSLEQQVQQQKRDHAEGLVRYQKLERSHRLTLDELKSETNKARRRTAQRDEARQLLVQVRKGLGDARDLLALEAAPEERGRVETDAKESRLEQAQDGSTGPARGTNSTTEAETPTATCTRPPQAPASPQAPAPPEACAVPSTEGASESRPPLATGMSETSRVSGASTTAAPEGIHVATGGGSMHPDVHAAVVGAVSHAQVAHRKAVASLEQAHRVEMDALAMQMCEWAAREDDLRRHMFEQQEVVQLARLQLHALSQFRMVPWSMGYETGVPFVPTYQQQHQPQAGVPQVSPSRPPSQPPLLVPQIATVLHRNVPNGPDNANRAKEPTPRAARTSPAPAAVHPPAPAAVDRSRRPQRRPTVATALLPPPVHRVAKRTRESVVEPVLSAIPPLPASVSTLSSGVPHARPTEPQTVCVWWLSQQCRYGSACRFSHQPLQQTGSSAVTHPT